MPSLCAVLAALSLGAVVCSQTSAQPTKVGERLQQFVAEGEIAGAVTLFARDGQTVQIDTVGQASIHPPRPMVEDTIFAVKSMTKPMTATALMMLVDEGKVSLDDPVSKYIPAFANAKLKNGEAVKGLTIRRLLTHTSGLTGKQNCETSLEATAEMLAARPFEFQPGEKWEYGPGLNVIGRIIEIASGAGYEEFMRQRLFRPLGMTDATFLLTEAQGSRLAKLYKRVDGILQPVSHWGEDGKYNGVPNPSGGVFATAADMARFYNMILAGGELDGVRIVSADAVKQMTTIQTGDIVTGFTPGNGWGLGWCVVRQPQGETRMLSPGTFGHGGAYGTQGWVDPVQKTVFVLMTQREDFPNSDASAVREEFQRLAVATEL